MDKDLTDKLKDNGKAILN